jgi:hypothetical protein
MKRTIVLLSFAACGGKSPAHGGAPLPPETPATYGKLDLPQQLVGSPLFVSDVDGLLLFEDEQLEAANLIAAWAKGQGLIVENPVRTRQIFARAARGQHADTGQACGAPLWRTLAISRWRAQMNSKGRIEVGVYCTPTCWLDLRLSLGLDVGLDDGPTAFYAAPYDPSQPWRTELAKRLGEVIAWQAPGEPNEPIAGVPGAKPMPAVTDAAFDRDHDAQATSTVPPAFMPAAKQCIGTTAAAGFIVETNASGVVEHCEPYDRRIIANVPAADCICKGITGTMIGGGARRASLAAFGDEVNVVTKAGLRVAVSDESDRAQNPMTGLYDPIASDPSVSEWEPPKEWVLAPCFETATDAIEAHVQVEFRRDGSVSSVKLDRKAGTITPAMESCVRAAFLAVRAPCPDVDKATADATLQVELRKP